jgi:hypothetical protein
LKLEVVARRIRRALIGILALACLVLWGKPQLIWYFVPTRDVEVFDVGARAKQLAHESPRGESLTDWYYRGPHGSAHLHVIGKGLTCELHLHERTVEATVPVMGSALVTQRYAVQAVLEEATAHYAEGTLIVSPPYCAHSWTNPSATSAHGSLVVTLGDAFPGNTFVGPDDPRILRGAEPLVFDPLGELERFTESGELQRTRDFPVAKGSLSAVFLKDSLSLEPSVQGPTLVYTIAGEGRVDGHSDRIPLSPTVLVVLHLEHAVRIVASPQKPLAALIARFGG